MDLVIDQLGAEHKKASEDAVGSKVDDRAVLGNESTRGPNLVEMSEAGQLAGIGEAFDHKEIGAGGDERVHHSVSPE